MTNGVHESEKMDVDKIPNGSSNGKRARTSEGKTYKEATSSDDDAPLTKKRRTSAKPARPEDSDSDQPLTKQVAKERGSDVRPSSKKISTKTPPAENKPKKKVKKEESDDDDDVPLAKKAAPKPKPKPKSTTERSDTPKTKAKAKAKPKESDKATEREKVQSLKKAVKKEESKDDEAAEDEEEEYRFWEQNPNEGDDSIKWKTLDHNGVVFPPEYQPLPSNVKLVYDGSPVSLKSEAEEIAFFYGSMLHSTVNVENPTFNENFFKDFKKALDKTGHGVDKHGNKVKIEKFDKCNFRPIFEHVEADRAARKARSSAEKKEEKTKKDEAEAPYMYCTWDGRKQKVGNFRVEPPGLFRGRGAHPKTGMVKTRVAPEQITINIGKEANVPRPPEGHTWKEIKHDQTGTWLATWQENINGAYKYVMLAANSDIKGQSDHKKFEKARELEKHIGRIRKDYTAGLNGNKNMGDRQMATAMYLIDKFALRAGNEKGEEEAETVGCCSLKYEHITLKPPNVVIFDFLGKDSIRFYNEFEVDGLVFTNLRIFKKDKAAGDDVFDRVSTSSLNKHLGEYMNGLTAKVFRTYNASRTMSDLLQELKAEGTIPEKVKRFNDANREVAIICNHKRTVAAGHEGQMEKLSDRVDGLRYQQWRLKQQMLDLEPKLKKKKGAEFFELPEGLDEDWVKQHQQKLVEEQREKIKKKFEKDNEKRLGEGEKKLPGKELEERLEKADEEEKKFKKENKLKKIEAEGKAPSVEKLETNIEKLDQRIQTMKVQTEDKESNKEVALGTSKIVSHTLARLMRSNLLTNHRTTLTLA